jgi:heme ABC exporter ATP-binding subunit CcmA
MIDVHHVTKKFGPHEALIAIDLHISAGERVVLVGPNGAGKTTLLRTIGGLVRPTSGDVYVSGSNLTETGPAIRSQIGYLSHRSLLYEDLTVEQNLAFYARLYGIPDAATRVQALLNRVALTTRRVDRVGTLSRGMKQRLTIARAILHQPSILLLDEPYTGLDPIAADAVDELLTDLSAHGCTQLMSTHRLEVPALNQTGQRIVMLRDGRIIYDGPYEATFPQRYRTWVTENRTVPIVFEGLRSTTDSVPKEQGPEPAFRSRTGFATHVWAIVSKDTAAELHTREIISAMTVFAILALFIFSVTLDLRGTVAKAAAPGVLWSIIAFTGMLGLSRSLVREHQTGGIEGLRAAPVDPTAIFFGKALGVMILMLLVESVLLLLTTIFLNVPLLSGNIVITLILGTIGYASVGTLLSAIAVNTRAREVMLPILLLPIMLPLFLSAAQTTRGLLGGAPWTDLGPWTHLLIVYDLIMIAISMVLFRYTLEE